MFVITVNQVNQSPTLDPIPNPAALPANAPTQTIPLTGISAGTGESQTLMVTASSDTPSLIPNDAAHLAISYTSPNATGTLTFQSVANATGTATITVKVKDNGGTQNGGIDTVIQTFVVAVAPPNFAPVVTTSTGTLNYVEKQNPTAIDPGVTVTDQR